jgi:hypothetical protein
MKLPKVKFNLLSEDILTLLPSINPSKNPRIVGPA